jgi:hypothetical protein
MTRRLSRRTVLLGGAAGAAAVLGGGLALSASGEEELTRSVLARLIGPFNMSLDNLRALVAAVDKSAGFPRGYKLHMIATLERAGWSDAVVSRAPASVKEDFQALERAILTEFVVGTNYLAATKPGIDPIVHNGVQPCSSPFANFASA